MNVANIQSGPGLWHQQLRLLLIALAKAKLMQPYYFKACGEDLSQVLKLRVLLKADRLQLKKVLDEQEARNWQEADRLDAMLEARIARTDGHHEGPGWERCAKAARELRDSKKKP